MDIEQVRHELIALHPNDKAWNWEVLNMSECEVIKAYLDNDVKLIVTNEKMSTGEQQLAWNI